MRYLAPVWDTSKVLSNITIKHPVFYTYSFRSSAVARWHRARPEAWARVAPAAPKSHSPGSEPSEAQFGLVIRRPQCSLARRRDRAISARRCSTKLDCAPPLCEELAPASGNLAIVSPKSSEMRRLFVSEYILESEQASRPSRPPARPHAPAARPWGTPRNASTAACWFLHRAGKTLFRPFCHSTQLSFWGGVGNAACKELVRSFSITFVCGYVFCRLTGL